MCDSWSETQPSSRHDHGPGTNSVTEVQRQGPSHRGRGQARENHVGRREVVTGTVGHKDVVDAQGRGAIGVLKGKQLSQAFSMEEVEAVHEVNRDDQETRWPSDVQLSFEVESKIAES